MTVFQSICSSCLGCSYGAGMTVRDAVRCYNLADDELILCASAMMKGERWC
jgi:hypothetical protein